MIVLKIMLLFLFCDLFIYVEAQRNSCTTPEGNEGVCMNIWECSERVKYIFSNEQSSLRTYNTLKSVCDYTYSVIKLCCSDSTNTESTETSSNRKVRESYPNEKPMKRQDFPSLKNNQDCDKNNSNTEDYNDNEVAYRNGDEFNKSSEEHHFEDVDKDDEDPERNMNVDNGKMHMELIQTESSTTEDNQKSSTTEDNQKSSTTEDNQQSSTSTDTNITETKTLIFNNKTIKPKEQKLKGLFQDTNLTELLKENASIPVEFKVLMNSDNEVNNNTFIIVNMRDTSKFVNNNANATFIIANLGEQTPTNTATNSSTNPPPNNNNNISISLFKKILCLILGKNSTELTENDDNSINNVSRDEDKPDYDYIYSSEESRESRDEDKPDYDYIYSSEESREIEDYDYISLPNPPHCGRGENAWQVILKERGSTFVNQFCKGTLVTRQHIVTTAYCVMSRNIESILIRSQKFPAYITLQIKDIKVHKHFWPHHIQNDIALIILETPIELEEVSPICLKVDAYLPKNLTGIVAYAPGYIKRGYRNAGEPFTKAVQVISEYECINELNDLREYMEINDHVFCTRNNPDERDICLENEGSPLIINQMSNGQTYYYQIGIVSNENHCSDHNSRPGIFVNINLYLNWILKNM